MDIGSNNSYPSSALSNFSAHAFEIDGIKCASMEGFLQSLKFKGEEMQKEVCTYIGIKAKRKGYGKNWWTNQCLYWKGEEIPRDSKRYQELITKAYDCMYRDSQKFREALAATGTGAVFTHSIGKKKINETVLTESEFCGQLTRLRDKFFLSQNMGLIDIDR